MFSSCFSDKNNRKSAARRPTFRKALRRIFRQRSSSDTRKVDASEQDCDRAAMCTTESQSSDSPFVKSDQSPLVKSQQNQAGVFTNPVPIQSCGDYLQISSPTQTATAICNSSTQTESAVTEVSKQLDLVQENANLASDRFAATTSLMCNEASDRINISVPKFNNCLVVEPILTNGFNSASSDLYIGSVDSPLEVPIQLKVSDLSAQMHQLNSKVDAVFYLNWLEEARKPEENWIAMSNSFAPPDPSPKLPLIGKSDDEAEKTIDEYKRLCELTLEESVRMTLRTTAFNNWDWSDAWLIRFVRQMFQDLRLISHFDLSIDLLDRWLCAVYRRYNRVPFHNYQHAFMVSQMCYALLWSASLTDVMTLEDQLVLMVATICHDLDHPGFNNAFQINARTKLAVRYNDQSPLENHHAATAFDVLLDPQTNPFSSLDPECYTRLRKGVIQCILATDMSRHNDIVHRFQVCILDDVTAETGPYDWLECEKKKELVLMMLIKASDISNESRPLRVAEPWIERLLEEFFQQSDYEKLMGLPVAAFMDRDKVVKSVSQCGFIKFVILPLFRSLSELLPQLDDVLVQPAFQQLEYYKQFSVEET